MTETPKRETAFITVRGVVQGVGFRPFIYRLAEHHGLTGWVCNTSKNVLIEVEGNSTTIDSFIRDVSLCKPPRAVIEDMAVTRLPEKGYSSFEIRESVPEPGEYQLISPDIATCPDCVQDIFDASNRRYRYPFTNCTNCGPRFTIIEDIPYDRPLTTMKEFTMCEACRSEYDNPLDRRFHAQPNACPSCGPALTLTDPAGRVIEKDNPCSKTAALLQNGSIVAIKGLGGFLLACDATSEQAVTTLRQRKHRPSKPFAVMVPSVEAARTFCEITKEEEALLVSPGAPIVLVKWNQHTVCPGVAPNNLYLGIMLPYTPLHHLLMNDAGIPLVMTSGNLSEEPIAKDNDEALTRLAGIADFFLMHNRNIYSRYDDSVMVVQNKTPQMIRRARGFAPYPVKLTSRMPSVLACGAELKNSFTLTRDEYAFVSQHIGDMENLETLDHYETTVSLYRKLFRINPEIIACDLHPDYLSTKFAHQLAGQNPGVILKPVQHHHAHIAGCMADNGLTGSVIGVSFDGTGYGTDGNIWGSEFMVADLTSFTRLGHFEYLPLPGGDAATKKPYRIAIGYLYSLFGEADLDSFLTLMPKVNSEEVHIIREQIEKKINSPLTSSCGRLFDAVSALLGLRMEIDYEAQAAVDLEMLAGRARDTSGNYPFTLGNLNGINIINLQEIFSGIIADLHEGIEKATIASKFHNTAVAIIFVLCKIIAENTGIKDVVLSGGVFQNRLLLTNTVSRLRLAGFNVYTHRQVPANDGGISLGQAVIAGFSR
ncbi:MAG: carbamoyltransferase HypF [Dehalococcoidales bacterium]|jgi:hydrogenase maturation protein HypF|nr:carbamoyltransferase HypF [Dehalococcoidales bacterium]